MKKIVFILISALLICSCIKPNNTTKDSEAKLYLSQIMQSIYYWNERIPGNIDSRDMDIYEYWSAILPGIDRWSWMTNGEDWNERETGIYKSYGASLMQPIEYYGSYEIKIAYVHPGSPLANKGVTRGWTLTHIGGTPVMELIQAGTFNEKWSTSPNDFTFRDLSNIEQKMTVTAGQISTKSALPHKVFTSSDYPGLTDPVGYFHYLTFNSNMTADIDNAIAAFNSAGVKELILDLRYNGGGALSATEHLVNRLVSSDLNGSVLMRLKHNKIYSDWDSNENSSVYINSEPTSLNLKRLFVITGAGSASASEVLVNGLKPLMDIISVGDTTYGKPNGMYVFLYPEGSNDANAEYAFLPICFYNVNSEGFGEYEDGLIPFHYRPDDLYNDFTVTEDNIKACLHYVVNGTFPSLPSKGPDTKSIPVGFQIPKTSDDPGYGTLYIKY